jgi:hypothetical protein
MLGPDENEYYQEKYDKMMAGPNKFKPGDIITDFKNNLRGVNIRPAKDWVRDVGGSITWRVNSVERNGDYKLQRLDTLTTEPLKEKDSPRYQPEVTKSKEMIDYWSQYKIWNADDVKAIYKVGLDAQKKEKEVDEEVDADIKAEIAELTPKVQEYVDNSIKEHGKYTIEETYNNFDSDLPVAAKKWSSRLGPGGMEFIWNMMDPEKLKLANDYTFVKKKLFGNDDKDFQNFNKATSVILHEKNNSIAKNASTQSVLGNPDLHGTIGEYFRRSTKGGKKTKKRGQKSKKRRRKSVSLRKK